MKRWKILILCIGIAYIVGCASNTTRKSDITVTKDLAVHNPVPKPDPKKNGDQSPEPLYDETGTASYISDDYEGAMTASGIRYNKNKMTAAHPFLPFETRILITNLRNDKTAEVVVIDRFQGSNDRIVNVSYKVAEILDFVESGVAKVGIKIIAKPE